MSMRTPEQQIVVDMVLAEIATRLRAYDTYPFAFGGPTEYVMRKEVFNTIARAITTPGKGTVQE
jgi:hypothetical protein